MLIWLKRFLDTWIDQFRYIKIQPKTIDLSTRLLGINPTNSVFIPTSLVLRSIVLSWILIYRNWSIVVSVDIKIYGSIKSPFSTHKKNLLCRKCATFLPFWAIFTCAAFLPLCTHCTSVPHFYHFAPIAWVCRIFTTLHPLHECAAFLPILEVPCIFTILSHLYGGPHFFHFKPFVRQRRTFTTL